ncbi:hypothetical protein LPTSP3_g18650 [Leptospira kobayashii]|uniref:Organic solvent tolerance-like N-terminal domain-containing protein n=1 Tax=Leptospira kobayashii TaxID=1917830 RepID=A0ABM7UJM4_9LEPT|nr:LptA/OstA family protein [Leptospira kobayashii]BDA78935.1 hypothetical protein LPTSP3_g18650 [Leptospira kobayashii]
MKQIGFVCLFLSLVSLVYANNIDIPILIGSDDIFRISPADPNITKTNDKKKEKIPVMWGGNTLTQEERLINGFQMKVFILGGGAYITHKNVKLNAREIEVIGEDALIGNLKGQVVVEDKENGATLIASKGVYDKLLGTVTLENHPVLIHKKDGKTVRISCHSIVRYLEEARTVLSGKVVVTSLDFQVFGEDAVYFEKEDRIDLENEPFLFSENRFLQGKILSYYVKEGSITLDGNAAIYQVSYEKGNENIEESRKNSKEVKNKEPVEKEKIRIISTFSGDRLVHKNKASESFTSMKGNAFLHREDSEFKAEEIESTRNNKLIQAKKNVTYLDKKNAYRMQGGYLEYDKEKGYSFLSENPQIFFLDKKTLEEKGNLSSVFIERFDEKKEAVARGNVNIQTQTAKATGEFATYFEEEDKLVLEGNPTLVRDGTKVSAGRIILFPSEDKAVLTDGLKVLNDDKKN